MKTRAPGLVQIHVAVFLFGLAGLFGKFLALPSVVIVLGRTVFAAITLFAVLLATGKAIKIKNKKDLFLFLILGAVLAAHWTTFFYSIQISTVAVGLLSFSTFPVFITFMEPVFFKERLQCFDLATAILVTAGLWVMVSNAEIGGNIMLGVFWGTVSGFTFAVLSLLNKKWVQRHAAITIAFYQNLFAAIVLAPFLVSSPFRPSMAEVAGLALLGILCTALAHALFISSLTFVKTQLAGIITALEPVYGIVFAFILLGEIPSTRTISGGLLILCTVTAAMIKPGKQRG